jgi:type II secretory pathway component PulC
LPRAWQIGEIADGSPLKEILGFRRGDIIISVNERPARADSARQLFEELRNERVFRVLIDRGGTRIEVPYTVK